MRLKETFADPMSLYMKQYYFTRLFHPKSDLWLFVVITLKAKCDESQQ